MLEKIRNIFRKPLRHADITKADSIYRKYKEEITSLEEYLELLCPVPERGWSVLLDGNLARPELKNLPAPRNRNHILYRVISERIKTLRKKQEELLIWE